MIPAEDFAMMVSEDIKGKADNVVRDLLREPSNRERWKQNLSAIIEKVNTQIQELSQEINSIENSYKSFDFNSDPAYSTRNKLERAERFRYHAEKRLAEVDRLMSMGDVSEDMKLASFLRMAIERHMELKTSKEAHDEIDESLWSCLTGAWGFRDSQ